MNEGKIASRYAKALLSMDNIHEKDLVSLQKELHLNPKFKAFLHAPHIAAETKEKMLLTAFSKEISKDAIDFLLYLVQKNRLDFLDDILSKYQKLKNILNASLSSAIPLPDETQQLLKERLQTSFGKEIRLKSLCDHDLIGGLVIKVDNLLLDMSLKGSLKTLKNQLEQ